jgi:hypothetical protein
MQRTTLLFFLLLCSNLLTGQPVFSAKKVLTSEIPAAIKYKGKIQEAWKWKDSLGENWFLLTATDIIWIKNNDEQTKQLFAYHYCKKDTGYRLLWKLNDLIQQCPVDIVVESIKGATSITDIDKDGIAETTLLYKLACRGDVSPADMKLIMHEDSVKYALRGSMWSPFISDNPEKAVLPVTEKDVNLETLPGYKGTEEEYFQTYGRYKTEIDFANAPASFLHFARRLWLRYAKESFE